MDKKVALNAGSCMDLVDQVQLLQGWAKWSFCNCWPHVLLAPKFTPVVKCEEITENPKIGQHCNFQFLVSASNLRVMILQSRLGVDLRVSWFFTTLSCSCFPQRLAQHKNKSEEVSVSWFMINIILTTIPHDEINPTSFCMLVLTSSRFHKESCSRRALSTSGFWVLAPAASKPPICWSPYL